MILLAIEGSSLPVIRHQAFSIGSKKAGQADVLLDDEYVSNLHARVVLGGSTWWIADMGSTNGTWRLPMSVHSKLLQPHPIAKGDKFRLGHTIITFIPDEVDTSHPEAVAFE